MLAHRKTKKINQGFNISSNNHECRNYSLENERHKISNNNNYKYNCAGLRGKTKPGPE